MESSLSAQTKIRYVDSPDDIAPEQIHGFFQGWPDPPSPETHLRLLERSDYVVLAVDDESGDVVGFVTAITDHVLAAYIPFLEVRPGYRGRGIGSELMRRMLDRLQGLYMVDLVCDPELRPFYASVGMSPITAMMVRNPARQSGRPAGPAADGEA